MLTSLSKNIIPRTNELDAMRKSIKKSDPACSPNFRVDKDGKTIDKGAAGE